MNVIFFGSFLEYSVIVLNSLLHSNLVLDQEKNSELKTEPIFESEPISVIGVVTTPPKPAGRKQQLLPTPVHIFAKKNSIPVLAPEVLTSETLKDVKKLGKCDYFVTAGYGKLLPASWLNYPKLVALNIHFSLLPKFRGANPGEWAIINQESTSGVSYIEMSEKFDTGAVLAQATIPITKDHNRESLYQDLYVLAGETVNQVLQNDYKWRAIGQRKDDFEKVNTQVKFFFPPQEQKNEALPFARKLNKKDSWISPKLLFNDVAQTQNITESLKSDLSPFLYSIWKKSWNHQKSYIAEFLDSAVRALTGFPCIWSTINTKKGKKRIKIFSGAMITKTNSKSHQPKTVFVPAIVQIEGQQKTKWNQVKAMVIENSNC
jgi:methionyl-tRNA formyltransferase